MANLSTKTGPQFIIGGAQKSGTTSLHHILDHHPNIQIVPGEVNFLSWEDPNERPFVQTLNRRLTSKQGKIASLDDYLALFSAAHQHDLLIGEDSTTYLSSKVAAVQITNRFPSVKLIFILRNPIDRAYSHYWHQVVKGRAYLPFDKWVNKETNIIRRGMYGQHLTRYFDLFDKDQILVLIFEEFVRDKQAIIDKVCRFLGLNDSISIKSTDVHQNRARIRNNESLGLFFNRIDTLLPEIPILSKITVPVLSQLQNTVNPIMKDKNYPPMGYSTRQVLQGKFANDTELLAELLEKPLLLDLWGMRE